MMDTVEDTATEQVTKFIQEIGKWSAIIIVTILGLLFADDQIPESKVLLLAEAAQLLGFALVLYIVIKIVTRPVKSLKFNYGVMTKNFIGFQEFQQRFNTRMVGTVDALENYTELALYERSIETGYLVRANSNWERMFGWSMHDVNIELGKFDGNVKKMLEWYAEEFVTKPSRKRILYTLKDIILNGNEEGANFQNIKLRRKDTSEFAANMQVAVIRDNGHSFTKVFITDMEELRHKQAVIENLISLVKMIDNHFGKNTNKIKNRQKLIDEIKLLRKDIKNGLR